jgi:hypothetical protein
MQEHAAPRLSGEASGARSATSPVLLQSTLFNDPPICSYCKTQTDTTQLERSGSRDFRGVERLICMDRAACRVLDRAKFAERFGDNDRYMRRRDEGIANGDAFLSGEDAA